MDASVVVLQQVRVSTSLYAVMAALGCLGILQSLGLLAFNIMFKTNRFVNFVLLVSYIPVDYKFQAFS